MKVLSWSESLNFLQNNTDLTRSGSLIAQRIIEEGRVFMYRFSPTAEPFPVMDVHYFLNHRIDSQLMELIGMELANILKPYEPELIITAATSGIAPTQMAARYLGYIPYVYARKELPITFKNNPLKASSFSITGGHSVELYISQRCLKPKTRIVMIDDFLDMGILAKNIIKMIDQAKCYLTAAAFVIEKCESRGRKKLNASGLSNSRINSLLKIVKIAPGKIQIAGIPYWLSLKH